MEQITKSEGKYYFGDVMCSSVEDVYMKFRNEYHSSLGKNVYGRLNRLGSRKERIHGYGIIFNEEINNPIDINLKIPIYLLGIVGDGYCRMLGLYSAPEMDEETYEKWIDYIFQKGSKSLRTVGTNYKAGRTSKLLNKNYR